MNSTSTSWQDFTIVQGATFSDLEIQLTDIDPITQVSTERDLSTGYTALFQIRENYADYDATVIYEATQANDIELTDDGWIKLVIPATDTEDFDFTNNLALFDLTLKKTSTGVVEKIYIGRVKLQREVSRP